jgi:hypothetical protein
VSDAEIYHLATEAGHPLLGLRKPHLGRDGPPRLLRQASLCALLTTEELRLRPALFEQRLRKEPVSSHP